MSFTSRATGKCVDVKAGKSIGARASGLSAVVPFDIFWITVSAVVLTFLSTLYPAWSASRLDPVEALRYE